MSGKRLTKILTLVAALAVSGGAFASQGQLSPNLTIVVKAEKSDKKQKNGFTALLKRSAQNWGRGFVRLMADAGRTRRHLASTPVRKASPVAIKLASLRGNPTCLHSTIEIAACFEQQSDVNRTAKSYTKEGLEPNSPETSGSSAQSRPICGLPGQGYALELPSLRRLIDWFRPVARVAGSMSDKTSSVADLALKDLAWLGQGEICPLASAAGRIAHGFDTEFHFTIDLTEARTSLAHGAMGAGSALSGDRSRNHRA